MAGKVVVSTLNNDTGVLATQNGMTGIPKAWVTFNGGNNSSGGAGSTGIISSFNVTSLTVNGTGNFTINYTTAMPSANYAYVGTATFSTGTNTAGDCIGGATATASSLQFVTGGYFGSTSIRNQYIVNIAVFSTT